MIRTSASRHPLLIGALLFIVQSAIGQTPAETAHRRSKTLLEEKKFEAALQEALRSVELEPTNGAYAFHLGNIYLFHTGDREQGLQAFTRAHENGYDTPMVFHRKAMCLFHLSRYHEAVDQLNASIARNLEHLKAAANPQSIRREIADCYDWLTKQYKVLGDWEDFYEAAEKVGEFDPHNQWASGLLREAFSMRSYIELGNGNYDEAEKHLNSFLDTRKEDPGSATFERHMLDLIQKRRKLGTITPDHVHTVMIMYLDVNLKYEWKGKRTEIKTKTTEGDRRFAVIMLKAMKQVIEALSNGHLSLQVDSLTVKSPLTIASISGFNANGVPGFRYDKIYNIKDTYRKVGDSVDTFFYVSRAIVGEAHGGSHSIYYPSSPKAIGRGFVEISAGFGFDAWLHEFFHTIEHVVGIDPAHGQYEQFRHHFPAWKGETSDELSYFQHHFDTTIPLVGWKRIRYLPLPTAADTVAKYLAEARRLGGMGFVDRAVEQYQKAISAAPGEWRHSYSLGEYLLANTEQWDDARAAFVAAWDKGHQRGITRHKIAITFYRQGEHRHALEELERAIEMNRAALPNASKTDAAHLRFQIADSYLWWSRVARDAGQAGPPVSEKMHRELVEAVRLNAANRDLRVKILQHGHFLFANGDYDDAVRLYQLAFHDTATGRPRRDVPTDEYIDWGIDPGVMLDLAENHRRLGPIKPEYTHKIIAVLYHRILEFRGSGMRSRVLRSITETQKRETREKLKWLVQVIESLSNGRFSLEVVQLAEAAPDTGAGPESPGGSLGDTKILSEKINEFDTIVRIWPMEIRTRAWAEETYPDLRPSRSTSARRGILNIGPDHPHGIWLHEFFHLLEMLAGIAPSHGYLPEERKQFPGWKGRTGNEMHYYRWHFAETFPVFGWKNLNFRLLQSLK